MHIKNKKERKQKKNGNCYIRPRWKKLSSFDKSNTKEKLISVKIDSCIRFLGRTYLFKINSNKSSASKKTCERIFQLNKQTYNLN